MTSFATVLAWCITTVGATPGTCDASVQDCSVSGASMLQKTYHQVHHQIRYNGTEVPTCGIKGEDNSPWIVNGQDATECEWGWQAQLRKGSSAFCGGTLISNTWVLTAGHCIGDKGPDDFVVVLGDYNKNSADDGQTQWKEIKTIVKHPNYRGLLFDYALLELKSAVTFNSCVAPACLPTVNQALTGGEECWITGWGTLSSGGSQPPILQEAKVSVTTNEFCGEAYAAHGNDITAQMVCAQGTKNGSPTDACQGDSGGPLVCKHSDNKYYVHGATSWGRGCAHVDFPGVWARVTDQLAWIHSVTGTSPPADGPPPGPPGPDGPTGFTGPPGPPGPPR